MGTPLCVRLPVLLGVRLVLWGNLTPLRVVAAFVYDLWHDDKDRREAWH